MSADMAAISRRELTALFAPFQPDADTGDSWTFDESLASQARITLNRLKARFDSLFDRKAKRMAERMLMKQDRYAKSSLAESLRQMAGGLNVKTDFYTGPLKESINASINYNVGLIRNLKDKYLFQIEGAVQRSVLSGRGMADLVPELEKIDGMTARRARDIALDQTKKTYASITEHRMLAAGIEEFEWLHSGGSQNPRVFHKTPFPNGLNGGIFKLRQPPVTDPKTGHRSLPGEDRGCNCKKIPVYTLREGAA